MHAGKKVEVVDVGCGFGGLLIALAPLMPDTLILGERKRTEGNNSRHFAFLSYGRCYLSSPTRTRATKWHDMTWDLRLE